MKQADSFQVLSGHEKENGVMRKRQLQDKAAFAVEQLKKEYPSAICSLGYEGDPWRLMIMGRLSAQCTDARVNIVSEELFRSFPTAAAMADGDLEQIERIVRPCGLYKMKASQIKEESRMLTEQFGGKMPDTMEQLLLFPGVGRKIANLILGDIFHLPAVVTDTHCIRICGRLGFYPESLKDPGKVEKILSGIIEPGEQSDFCHRLVLFGRDVCQARSPKCENCPLRSVCEHNSKRG